MESECPQNTEEHRETHEQEVSERPVEALQQIEPSTTDTSVIGQGQTPLLPTGEYISHYLQKQLKVFNASIDYNHYLIYQQFADIAVTNSIQLKALEEMRSAVYQYLAEQRKLIESTQILTAELNKLPQNAVDAQMLLQSVRALETRLRGRNVQ